MYDYLIVGSGLFGSVFAREMTNNGFKCLIVDKRSHIGGNVYTEQIDGINIHKYGAHIFHTNDKEIWDYVNQFSLFNNYRHKVFVKHNEQLYSFPINLMTFTQLWGITTPSEAKIKMNQFVNQNVNTDNLEKWILSNIGEDLYNIFIKGYTKKQWGRDPNLLPSSIIRRIPIRTSLNDFYFDDLYQGVPIGGYTKLIENMLRGIDVRLSVDYFKNSYELKEMAKNIVFTGPIDEFFNFEYGNLEYRSLNFVEKIIDVPDFQGTSVVNYTNSSIPFTRIIEHKHFEFGNQKNTIITREYPVEWSKGLEPFYPINDEKNNNIYKKYKEKSIQDTPNVIFGGRLAEYKYYDMHQVIGSALSKVKSIMKNSV